MLIQLLIYGLCRDVSVALVCCLLAGHSAGGQIISMLLNDDWLVKKDISHLIKALVPISSALNLLPLQKIKPINDILQMTE